MKAEFTKDGYLKIIPERPSEDDMLHEYYIKNKNKKCKEAIMFERLKYERLKYDENSSL